MQPVVTPAEMAAIDAAAPEPVEELIERAGAAVARAAIEMLGGTYGRRVVVVAGKGNNGNDGRAAARRLERRGIRCVVIDAGTTGDPNRAHHSAEDGRLAPHIRSGGVDLLIDAAYGTGFRGTFDPPDLDGAHVPVLAVDIPSGISGVTGVASGRPWRAARTVTFGALKPGLLLGDGPEHAGEITVADIGLDCSGARAHLVDGADVSRWLPTRARDTHKWRAAAWVVAGSEGMTGAAHLCTRAAQRAGAGYVRLSTPGSAHDRFAPTEAVVVGLPDRGWADVVLRDLDRFGALAVGPGLGTATHVAEQVRRLVARATVPTVVDGDGLRALGAQARDHISARPRQAAGVMLTPHDGEFEALTGSKPSADRFEAVRAAAAVTGAVVLLKGPTTLVARPDGEVWASDSGDARLATAGSGDVLTGIVAAFSALGVDPAHAAVAAAHLHGRAGALAWPRGVVATDLIDHLPDALAELPGG